MNPQDPSQPNQEMPNNPEQPLANVGPQPTEPNSRSMPPVGPPAPNANQPLGMAPVGPQPQPPAFQPAPGVPPAGPMGSFPTQPQPPTNSPLGRFDKKLIIWIAAGVGALVVIVIAVLLIVSSFSVSKADYETAYDYANDARTSYAEMSGLTYISTYATETEAKNNLDSFKQSQKEFNETVDALGKTKAVQHDGKANELYTSLTNKKKSFDTAVAALTETYEYIIPAMSEFNNASSSDLSKVLKVTNTARSKFEANESKLKDANNKELTNKLIPLFKKYATLLKKVEAYRDDYSKYDSKVASEFSSTATDISNAIRDWSSNLKSATNDAEIAKEFNDLGKYLSGKASS